MKNIKIKNFLFLTAWTIFLFYILLLNESELGYILDNRLMKPLVLGIVSFLSILKIIICDKYRTLQFIFIIILTIFISIVAYNSNNYNLIFFEFLIIASKGVDFKKIVQIDLIIRIICIIILCILCSENLINNYTAIINGNIKQAFGWLHPNTFGAVASIAILEYIYLNWEKLNLTKVLFAFVMICIVYLVSASRTNVYLISVIVIFSYFMKHFKRIRESNIIRKSCIYIYPIIAAISFFIVYLYKNNNNLGIILNEILTGRLYLANLFLDKYGLSLLGQPLNIITTRQALLTGTTASVLDMAYVRLIIQYGILYFILFIILNTKIQKNLVRNNKYPELMLIMYFAIIGLAENTVLNLYMNISLFLIMQTRESSALNEK